MKREKSYNKGMSPTDSGVSIKFRGSGKLFGN